MFGLSLIKTSSLNKMRANITQVEIEKANLQSQLRSLDSTVKQWRVKAEGLQHKITQLNKELELHKPVKDPKSGRFVRRSEKIQG